MVLKDSTGVPLEPNEPPHELAGKDWRGDEFYSDDFDDYIEWNGLYILDDGDTNNEHRAFLLEDGTILNTMEIYERSLENANTI